ncbi:MAG: hypothetical protein ACK4TL_20100 [Hyphomicrobiaceae bacterium]
MRHRPRTRSRGRAPGLDLATELLRLAEKVSRLEATASHARALWRTVEKRFEIGDGRMDRTDRALAEIRGAFQADLAALKGEIGQVRTLVESRAQEEQRRQLFRSDALKGGVLLLALLTGIGALLGKVPWSTFDIFAGALAR